MKKNEKKDAEGKNDSATQESGGDSESCPEKLLQNWAKQHIKHKNIMTRNLKEIKEKGYDLLAVHESKNHYYIIIPFMHGIEEVLEKMRHAKLEMDAKLFSVIVFNSKHNLKILIANWNKFIAYPELNFFFVNPFSKLDKKWIVNPHFHHRITEKASLESGLKSIFSTIEEIDEKRVEEIFGKV